MKKLLIVAMPILSAFLLPSEIDAKSLQNFDSAPVDETVAELEKEWAKQLEIQKPFSAEIDSIFMEYILSGKDDSLRRFATQKFKNRYGSFKNIGFVTERGRYGWRLVIDHQLSRNALSLGRNVKVKILELEACGPFYEEEDEVNWPLPSGRLDHLRIEHALKEEGLDKLLDQAKEPAEYQRHENITALNERLFELYESEKVDIPYMIIDYSEGCGSGGFATPTKLESEKPLRKVFLIKHYYARVCEKRYKAQWLNLENCPWWKPAKEFEFLGGRYKWRALDAEGKLVHGEFKVDTLSDEETIVKLEP